MKLVKTLTGYNVIEEHENYSSIVAKLEKHGKGYYKYLFSLSQKRWFNPSYFGYFPNLKSAKSFYNR